MANKITRAAIHPSIGIARIGNSPDPNSFFLAPEVPDNSEKPVGAHHDDCGFLKRQAARFRIYGYDGAGNVVRELTAPEAAITWTVHVANKKAAGYEFQVAMDIPEAIPVPRRNANLTGSARQDLVIDPGPRSISGQGKSGPTYHFDSGSFLGVGVYLGEIRTDQSGRLICLGGRGVSGTPRSNNTIIDFGNNDGWFDDTSDGPVTATVELCGEQIPVDPAWIVVAPPNYAPEVISITTMYDVMFDLYAYHEVWLESPKTISFSKHILPILKRFCEAQWVNFGFHLQFGWGAPFNFLRKSYLDKLASRGREYQEVRRQVFHLFRKPDYTVLDLHEWPQVYGDNMNIQPVDARQFLAVTHSQYSWLKKWSDGDFEADWTISDPSPCDIEGFPLNEQPETLDRTSLDFCIGGPFHPGCEMTWPMRHVSLYSAPFRIRMRTAGNPEPDFGPMLTPAVAVGSGGPLTASGPGDISRWLAVPWQADTASCRAGYEPEYDPFLPTFWPSRVPNHVLSENDYKLVMDLERPLDERKRAFDRRHNWYRGLDSTYMGAMNQMVTDFSKLGVVERRPGPGDGYFPATMLVESPPQIGEAAPHDRNNLVGHVGKGRHLAKRRRV